MATFLYEELKLSSDYKDKNLQMSDKEYQNALLLSSTVYVGNLSIYTKEESIYELFSQCGEIKDIKMGINKKAGTPIGFCFVEFYTHEEAGIAVNFLTSTKLEGRLIRVDWDIGFSEGRQYGRGKGGMQWRDCFREKEDPDRPKPLPKPSNVYQNNNNGGGYKRQKREPNFKDRNSRDSRDMRSEERGEEEGVDVNYKRKY